MRRSVVLPEPLRPDSVSRSRRSSRKETPRSSGSPAMSLAMSDAMTTATASNIGILSPDATDGAHAPAEPRPARPDGPGRARGGRSRRRRGTVGGDQRQGRHQRGLLPDRLLPAVHPADEPHPMAAGQAEGAPQGGREGAPRPYR